MGVTLLNTGMTIWLTGLPSSGKSTLAEALEARLRSLGRRVEVLDGDVVRTHLSQGLGFSREDREANIRRVGFVCEILNRHDVVAIAALVSPFRRVRDEIRGRLQTFVEVYVHCPLETCIQRDVKGLYARALRGEIPAFTGVSDPYEEPLDPEVVVETHRYPVEECVDRILQVLQRVERSVPPPRPVRHDLPSPGA